MDKTTPQYIKETSMANQSDHDILITLVETVKNNQVTVVGKIQDVKDKVEEVKDGISSQVRDHEIRIKLIEKIVDETNPLERLKEHEELYQWKNNFQFTWKFIVGVAAAVGGIVGFVISAMIGILNIIHPK